MLYPGFGTYNTYNKIKTFIKKNPQNVHVKSKNKHLNYLLIND